MNFSDNIIKHEMYAVFESEDKKDYEVFVSQYGTYPYVERELEEFVNKINETKE